MLPTPLLQKFKLLPSKPGFWDLTFYFLLTFMDPENILTQCVSNVEFAK